MLSASVLAMDSSSPVRSRERSRHGSGSSPRDRPAADVLRGRSRASGTWRRTVARVQHDGQRGQDGDPKRQRPDVTGSMARPMMTPIRIGTTASQSWWPPMSRDRRVSSRALRVTVRRRIDTAVREPVLRSTPTLRRHDAASARRGACGRRHVIAQDSWTHVGPVLLDVVEALSSVGLPSAPKTTVQPAGTCLNVGHREC